MNRSAEFRRSRTFLLFLLVITLTLALVGVPTAQARKDAGPAPIRPDKIAKSLQQKFTADGTGPQDFWIKFDSAAGTSEASGIRDWTERGTYVVDRLSKAAKDAQAGARALLDKAHVDYTSYWVSNAIRVHGGDYTLAQTLSAAPSVQSIFAPVSYEQAEPVQSKAAAAVTGPEWGVRSIKADQVWQKYGARGDGIVVASIDTGTELSHPALVEQYRGTNADGSFSNDYNWLDTSGASQFPTDHQGHGTHTMGTMVGDDGGVNQTGVAPGARWIEANGCCASDETLLQASQWMLAPTKTDGSAPDPSKRPNIVNNSWGSTNPTTEPFLEDIQQAWADSGIFGVWSNGNNGPGCDTSGSPGSRTLNYAVGAYSEDGTIASFSSRGPGQDGEVKPNISAPGDLVRSSYLNGRYALMSGTSMAAPHVAGAVALLLSAHPELIGDVARIRQLLDQTAQDADDTTCGGTAADNNVYGEGRLDALALVEAVDAGAAGAIAGKVTSSTGTPVSGAAVALSGSAGQRSTRTDANGNYSVANLPIGSYTATITAFGYRAGTATIVVTADQTTTTDVQLADTDGFTVSGTIADQTTGGPLAGTATIIGTKYVATADASGRFTLKGVPGPRSYTVKIDDGGRCAVPVYRTIQVSANTTVPAVELGRRSDQPMSPDGWWGGSYGYTCGLEPTTWIDGTQEVVKPHVYDSTAVKLPFRFTYFGKTYDTAYMAPGGIAQVGFWTTPYNGANYPYDEYGYDTVNYGLTPRLGAAFDDGQAQLYTRTSGTAPNRTFTMEFRNYSVIGQDIHFSYEVTLHERGDIVFAYHGLDPADPLQTGLETIVMINDHSPDGRAADRTEFTYSNKEPVLSSERQIHFSLPANGFVNGTVVDKAGKAVPNANVDLRDQNGWLAQRVMTDAEGKYRLQLMTGRQYKLSVLAEPGYDALPDQTVKLTTDRQELALRTTLSGGVINVPSTVSSRPGKPVQVALRNDGDAPLNWRARLSVPGAAGAAPGTELSKILFGKATTAVEEVDGQYWATDLLGQSIVQVTAGGDPTGAVIPMAPIAKAVGAGDALTVATDLAWVPDRSLLCMTLYRVTTDIACVNPAAPENVSLVRTGYRAEVQLVGLAYDADQDRFFTSAQAQIGGFQAQIRTLTGFGHTDPGELLGSCMYPRQASGLGFNPVSQSLWSHTEEYGDGLGHNQSVYRQIDPATCAEQSSLTIPEYSVAGLPGTSVDLDPQGNLITTFLAGTALMTVATPDPIAAQPRWASVPEDSGTLAKRARTTIPVNVTWPDGVSQLTLTIRGNGGAQPVRTVTIKRP
ncbi:S8 family serine peptidase [Kribbella sp. NPDC004875]|uniref:S8 family serine peptidase n=1 Tax=Kribbella sp. NPDC004875 TaxID=3364107 RepID=UPI003695ED37